MMSGSEQEFSFSLRVVLNQRETKVVYAAVSGDFVDVLLSFLTLPLGTIVRLVAEQNETQSLGSLSTLYKSLKDLDIDHFSHHMDSWLLLDPLINSFQVDDDTDQSSDISPTFESTKKEVGGGVFVTSHRQSFIITDDLKIFPDLPEYALRFIQEDFGLKFCTNGLRERTVSFGHLEMKKLLRCLLISRIPLTDVILNDRNLNISVPFVPRVVKYLRKLMSKKIKVTAFVQKATNRILSVQAQQDLVDFLFSLLTIPLGKAEFLLHGNTGLCSVDNLYRCIPSLKFVNTTSINSLLNPSYVSVNQRILPLGNLIRRRHRKRRLPLISSNICHRQLKGLKPNTFIVTDDLVVMTANAYSVVSQLQTTGIPLGDIETHVLHVGIEEALNILKASLTSSSALTNGLERCLNRRKATKVKSSMQDICLNINFDVHL